MRAKKIILLTALIIFVILSIFFMNSFLFPTLRCYRAQQLSVLEYDKSEYDSIIMAAYPSFNASNYILYDIKLDEKGFVALAYVNKEPPLITDVGFDADLDFLHVFRYDPLWNQIIYLSHANLNEVSSNDEYSGAAKPPVRWDVSPLSGVG